MEQKDHEFCLRCGRKLKNPIAREKGYGAICEKKMKASARKLFTKCDMIYDTNSDNLQSS